MFATYLTSTLPQLVTTSDSMEITRPEILPNMSMRSLENADLLPRALSSIPNLTNDSESSGDSTSSAEHGLPLETLVDQMGNRVDARVQFSDHSTDTQLADTAHNDTGLWWQSNSDSFDAIFKSLDSSDLSESYSKDDPSLYFCLA
jgi:hypothetical protein